MSLVAEIKDAFEVIKGLLGGLKRHRECQRGAIKSVLDAALATKQYERVIRSEQPSIEKEKELARLWLDAGFQMQSVSPELGHKCIIKAERWSDPEIWDEKSYPDISISLDIIIADSRTILSKT